MSYKKFDAGNSQPATIAETVTKHDTNNFTRGLCRGIYVGTGGNVAVVFENGTAVTFVGVPSGFVLPVMAKRVNSTNTTAADMVALF